MVPQDRPPTVRDVCRAYIEGHVERSRKSKGAAEVKRTFDTMLGEFADRPADEVSRGQAFALLETYAHIPVQAQKLRRELGAAWEYALDAQLLSDTTANWRRVYRNDKAGADGRRGRAVARLVAEFQSDDRRRAHAISACERHSAIAAAVANG
ncbi:hypothetical protein [Burkholderia perseverans]|uniref:hypothetical protein n=1 Tax=Burkholderia perseverans TaxID=2615214 RepID=UPI001FED8BFC|nr:hypothetical protein [Burkholderia perseverans]